MTDDTLLTTDDQHRIIDRELLQAEAQQLNLQIQLDKVAAVLGALRTRKDALPAPDENYQPPDLRSVPPARPERPVRTR